MKKLLLLLSFIILLNAAANAQVMQKSPEKRAAHMTKDLQKKLNLTAGQAEQVKAAFLNQAIRIDSLKNNVSIDKKANNLTRKTIVHTMEKQVLSVLNEDQKKQFIELQKMKRKKHMEMKARGANPQS